MKAGWARFGLLGLTALVAGCASSNAGVTPGVEVTRFHLGTNPARGEIAIEPLVEGQGGSLEFSRYADAVARELTALGWRVIPGNSRSEQVALIRIDQGTRAALRNRPAFSIGIGGGSFGSGVGVGGGLSVPVGRSGASQIVVTELAVRLQRRSDGTAIWEGRAQAEARAGTPNAYAAAFADQLASALFQGFPGESGQTIRIR